MTKRFKVGQHIFLHHNYLIFPCSYVGPATPPDSHRVDIDGAAPEWTAFSQDLFATESDAVNHALQVVTKDMETTSWQARTVCLTNKAEALKIKMSELTKHKEKSDVR